MIRITRPNAAPASLSSPGAVAQAQEAERFYATWHPGSAAFGNFTLYRGEDVKTALQTITHSKCAYCEEKVEKGSLEVEHYRPKGEVYDCPDHPGYWWLAFTWSNLLPTCTPCNQGLLQHLVTADMTVEEVDAMRAQPRRTRCGKATQFPVGLERLTAKTDDHFAEDPHLIDPTRTDPEPHLKWRHDSAFSVVEAAEGNGGDASIHGQQTIHCVALNRIDLVQNRTSVLRRLRVQKTQILEALEKNVPGAESEIAQLHLQAAQARIDDMWLSAADDQPYAGMVRAFMRAFIAEFEAKAEEVGYNFVIE